MRFKDFIVSRFKVILLNVVSIFLLELFLFSVGNTVMTMGIILAAWAMGFMIYLVYAYNKRKNYFKILMDMCSSIDKKYLISEVIDEPPYFEAVPYYMLLKKASKAMREEINRINKGRREYKEYIETWVHEVKTPISSIKLMEENNKTEASRLVLKDLDSIEGYVEQALFYARSDNAEKDYLVKEIALEGVINKVLIRNKYLFILNNIELSLNGLDINIYSDEKWVEFIINQIVTNSIKYRKDKDSVISIYANEVKSGVVLTIEDNGIGISSSDIGRIFDKGFTGAIGRQSSKSTGIGLYLCKKLCDKLGLAISAESKEQEYTKISIVFPKGKFCKIDS